MAISEQSRPEPYRRLEELLGREAAATLMEHLPPVGWGDVATKHDWVLLRRDLDHLEERLRGDMTVLEQRLRGDMQEAIGSALTSQTRTILFGLIGSNLTAVALGAAVASIR
jgi:hypothetical protein